VDISSVEQNTGSEPALYFVHSDHLTTPQVITNQSQSVVWVVDYEPFGKAKLGLLNSINLDSRFPGQYFDRETNLYYNYFRDYDPSIGRYIESDPIGLAGGINTYAYVEGNPVNLIDPEGLTGRGFSNANTVGNKSSKGQTPVMNFSIGAGGSGMYMLVSPGADSGLAFDTAGNFCFYSTICTGGGLQTPIAGALGIVGGMGNGALCSGQSDSKGVSWQGGKGLMGQGQVLTGSDGTSFSRGLFGVGMAGGGVGAAACHTTLVCHK